MAGTWKPTNGKYSWICVKESSTNFKCNGQDVTLKGRRKRRVTFVENGAIGILSGGNLIKWGHGTVQWKKEKGNQNSVHHN